MMDFQLSATAFPPPNPDGVVMLDMRAGRVSLTRLIRASENVEDASLRIPVRPLAFWFADNWWRLRWEPKTVPLSNSWIMAHEMAGIGDGHAWPRVTIWGDRDRLMLTSKADPPGVAGPVRFLTNAVTFVSAEAFETAVDQLLDEACRAGPCDDNKEALRALVSTLRMERSDPNSSNWRRLEAVAGYDADDAPEALVEDLLALESDWSGDDVEDAIAAAPGQDSARILRSVIEAAANSIAADFESAFLAMQNHQMDAHKLQPWITAENAARTLRESIGDQARPIRNRQLADLASISPQQLKSQTGAATAPYAMRLTRQDARHSAILLTARWSHDRRFQLARAIGDAIWTRCSDFGAISNTSSMRQKFQRAFAGALLCPLEGVKEYLGTDEPDDIDIGAAAKHFHVNEKTVRTVLVNKRLIERNRLQLPLSDPLDPFSVDDVAEAA